MMVIFLVGLVSMILMRTLRKDYARYSKEDDLDDMVRLLLYKGFINIYMFQRKQYCCVGVGFVKDYFIKKSCPFLENDWYLRLERWLGR